MHLQRSTPCSLYAGNNDETVRHTNQLRRPIVSAVDRPLDPGVAHHNDCFALQHQRSKGASGETHIQHDNVPGQANKSGVGADDGDCAFELALSADFSDGGTGGEDHHDDSLCEKSTYACQGQNEGDHGFSMRDSPTSHDGNHAARMSPIRCLHATDNVRSNAEAQAAEPSTPSGVIAALSEGSLSASVLELREEVSTRTKVSVVLRVVGVDLQSVAVCISIDQESDVAGVTPATASMLQMEPLVEAEPHAAEPVACSHAASPIVSQQQQSCQPQQPVEHPDSPVQRTVTVQGSGDESGSGTAAVAGKESGLCAPQQMSAALSSQNQIPWGKPFQVKV
jgi:hypothetical protein